MSITEIYGNIWQYMERYNILLNKLTVHGNIWQFFIAMLNQMVIQARNHATYPLDIFVKLGNGHRHIDDYPSCNPPFLEEFQIARLDDRRVLSQINISLYPTDILIYPNSIPH